MLNKIAAEKNTIRDTSAQDHAIDNSRRARSRLILILIASLVLIVSVVLTPMLGRWLNGDIVVARNSVRIAQVTEGLFVRDIAVQGSVVAAHSPTLFAPIDGTVTFSVNAGDRVEHGEVLARVDSPELSSLLAQEQATLDSMETNLERRRIENKKLLLTNNQQAEVARLRLVATERELTRAKLSWDNRLISEQDLKAAHDNYDVAKVDANYAKSSAVLTEESLAFELQAQQQERDRQRLLVKNLQRRKEDLTLRSPVSGIVGDLAVDQRAMVLTNTALLTVVDLSAFEIDVRVPENYSDDIHIGMDANLRHDGEEYQAMIAAISPQVNQGAVPVRLRFSAEAPQGLRQNQRLSGRIILEQKAKALILPRGSFLQSDGGRFAYRVESDQAIRTPILVGSSSVNHIEILDGLNVDDHIIISNTSEFNQAVNILLHN